ncbi:MAG: tRNA uridine-5-carboxymethylaminomethyl(34) synthesis GTPase MnmE [Spirochaetota bacterium]
MSRGYLDPPVPIFALATAPGAAALAVLRLGGAGCIEALARCFSRPARLLAVPGYSLVHGMIIDLQDGEPIDEVVVSIFRAPRSPTGEDQAEIAFHGSPAVQRRISGCLGSAGLQPALPGEFAYRAFANGRGDLVKAEAINELVAAASEGGRVEALKRLEGGLSVRLAAMRALLVGLLAEAEVRLDHAEEDGSPASLFPFDALVSARDKLAKLAASWQAGRLYREGVRVVLAGATNVGKSSLFNLLVREERAIVSPEPGTTRDWIESGFELEGLPVRLIDTAGLRSAAGQVEAQGIDRSRSLVAEADLVLHLADALVGLTAEDVSLAAARPDAIRLWNKADAKAAVPAPEGWLAVSALNGDGIPKLLEALGTRLAGLVGRSRGIHPAHDEFIISSSRQRDLLERATAALGSALALIEATMPVNHGNYRNCHDEAGGTGQWLDAVAVDVRDAADAIGELTGEIASPEVLDAIFSGFCLGK